jgi:hypothetical protein
MSIPSSAPERPSDSSHPVAEAVDELADEILEPMGLEILEMERVDRPAWPRLHGSILVPWRDTGPHPAPGEDIGRKTAG